MNFRDYQEQASQTDQTPTQGRSADLAGKEIMVPLLGLAGETGELLSEFKKYLRDGRSYASFDRRAAEELGDLLWYLTSVASKLNLDLEDIAKGNLEKCRARWGGGDRTQQSLLNNIDIFESAFLAEQRFPRKFDVAVRQVDSDRGPMTEVLVNGAKVGDNLTDNAYTDDGYRYHDIFHFVYAAMLGWSPVLRKLLKCKRKGRELTDRVEDGARAAALEEGISAMIFGYASENNWLEGAKGVRSDLLRTIKMMTRHLEVSRCSEGDWEAAIMCGFDVWREIAAGEGGTFSVDLNNRTVKVTSVLLPPNHKNVI